MYIQDDWPKGPLGVSFNGLGLWKLIGTGKSPFQQEWDVKLLIKEIEENVSSMITNIPLVSCGANYYGFHVELHNYPNVLARVARGDVNTPGFDGFPLERQISEIQFEAAVYKLLHGSSEVPTPRLIHYRAPIRTNDEALLQPGNITGRRLMVFEKEHDSRINWRHLKADQQNAILAQAAAIRAALFNFRLPDQFAQTWFLERLFEQKPASLACPVAPTRKFCLSLFTSKIHATIRNIGDMIGWESDNVTVGPAAAAAKLSLLRLIPHILPPDDKSEGSIYRLVLEHGDFGIHNMTISVDSNETAVITSLYDWETGCITPALLSDPEMAVIVNLTVDADAGPSASRVKLDSTAAELETYEKWVSRYATVHPLRAGHDVCELFLPAIA